MTSKKNSQVTTDFTRPEGVNKDEISSARTIYKPERSLKSVTLLKTVLKNGGCNPFNYTRSTRFDEEFIKDLTRGFFGAASEPLDKMVVRDCIAVSKKDVKNFNSDFDLLFTRPKMKFAKKITIAEQNYKLFARYVPGNDLKWDFPAKSSKKGKSKNKKADKGASLRQRRLRLKSVKETNKDSFISNLLFKVLF